MSGSGTRLRRRAGYACMAMTAAVSVVTGAHAASASRAAPGAGAGLTVGSAGMTVQVAPSGGISSVTFADGRVWQLGGRSLLAEGTNPGSADQCSPAGAAAATADGGAQWQTTCTDTGGHTMLLTETLAPAGDSVAWTLQVRSASGSYGKGIWTKLTGWSDSYNRQFWTTWGQSSNSADVRGQNPTWSDPLKPAPFTDTNMSYGRDFSVPIFTIVEPDTDHSLSLVQSPADTLLSAAVDTDTAGDVQFGRFDNRITATQPVTFHMNLVPSAGDWRGGLGWMAGHYPDYFQPAMTNLDNELSGLGSYSGYPGPFGDSLRKTLQAQDYKTNWELSLHGPYMGEFMPPVSSPDQQFPSFYHTYLGDPPATVSVNDLRSLEAHYADAGFRELGYFNTTEFGTGIQYPAPPRTRQCNDPQVWMNANDYLYCDFSQAMLINGSGQPLGSWEGAVVMDPGDPAYQQHLLDQAKALLTEVPYSGIDIDRLDWVEQFNTHADDGVSWYAGGPARSLVTSWKELMAKLTPMVHDMGKAVWVSPTAGTTKRIDWMKGIDGFLSEFDDGGAFTNLDAFLGLDKPVEGWNYNLDQNGQPTGPADGPDGFIQRFLYMGVYPMSDSPINDHGIAPISSYYEQYYKDYGPMFKAMRGKQWDLTPHAVSVTGSSALANVFTVPDGAVVPVVQGGNDTSATVTLRGLAQAKPGIDLSQAEYVQPGSTQWKPLPVTAGADGTVTATVPLSRGAAMIRFLTHPAEQGNTDASGQSASLHLTSSSQWVTQTQPATVTSTITNQSHHAITNLTASLTNPSGWTVSPSATPGPELGPGQSATFTWRVAAPPNLSGTVQELTAQASYQDAAGTQQLSDARRLAVGTPVPQQQITATATSSQPGNPASNATDGNQATMWQSQAGPSQSITLDLGAAHSLSGLTYLPRQDGALDGLTMRYAVSVSNDGSTFTPVAAGDWPYDAGLQAATFNASNVRYVRLETAKGVGNLASAAEINAVEAPSGQAQGPVPGPISPSTVQLPPGGSTQVSTTVTNPGQATASNLSAQLQLPQGWNVTPVTAPPASLGGGQTASLSWRLTAPASASPGAYQIKVIVTYESGGLQWSASTPSAQVYLGIVPQSQMTATATSFQPGWEPAKAIDGDPTTLWHTEWVPVQVYPPQSITLDLGGNYDVTGLRYLPRQDGYINGIITSYNIYASQDGTNFTKISSGSWPLDASEKTATFNATGIRYIRLEGVQAGNNFVSAAEINILGSPTS